MSDTINNPSGKEICFLDSNFDELFRIPDGGYITISHPNGEQLTRKCEYRNESHFGIDGERVYSIREFADIMAQVGRVYSPCPKPEFVQGYMITDRIAINDVVFVLAHNPDAVLPWVTRQRRSDRPGYDLRHYWANHSDAWADFSRRAYAEYSG